MNQKAKTLTPVLLILIILLVGLTMTSLFFLKKENVARTTAEKRLQQTEQMLDNLEAKLNDSNKLVLQLNEKIKDSQLKADDLTNQLNLAMADAKTAREERDSLISELENLKGSENEFAERLNNAQRELEEVKSQLKVASDEKAALENKIKELQASAAVPLDKIVVSHPETTEGNILVINKEHDFVIVNFGQKDNISVGQPLYIYQNDRLLGEAKVEKIQETMSVASFLDPKIISAIKEGDKVSLVKK